MGYPHSGLNKLGPLEVEEGERRVDSTWEGFNLH